MLSCHELAATSPHPGGIRGKGPRQHVEGYQLIFLRDQLEVKSVAGFRILEYLAWGKVLYIDDLITVTDGRGKGCGGRLMDWLIDYGSEQSCDEVHLDTGYQRHAAHRLYLRKGLELNCHHLAMKMVK